MVHPSILAFREEFPAIAELVETAAANPGGFDDAAVAEIHALIADLDPATQARMEGLMSQAVAAAAAQTVAVLDVTIGDLVELSFTPLELSVTVDEEHVKKVTALSAAAHQLATFPLDEQALCAVLSLGFTHCLTAVDTTALDVADSDLAALTVSAHASDISDMAAAHATMLARLLNSTGGTSFAANEEEFVSEVSVKVDAILAEFPGFCARFDQLYTQRATDTT